MLVFSSCSTVRLCLYIFAFVECLFAHVAPTLVSDLTIALVACQSNVLGELEEIQLCDGLSPLKYWPIVRRPNMIGQRYRSV